MLEPQQGLSVEDIVAWAEYAEKSGYGYIFRSDHILSMGKAKQGTPSPECWVSLGSLAAKTSKIKFGPMVTPIGFRNPAMLARMACTLHSYSKGRFILAVGAGWYEAEYKAHGYEFPLFKVRKKQFEEALKIIKPVIEGKRVDFDGEYFSAHLDCYPRPYGGKIHLVGGGRHPKIVEVLRNYVDEWNIFSSSLKTVKELKRILESSNRKITISQMGAFVIAESKAKVASKVKNYMNRMGYIDDPRPEKLVEKGVLYGTPEEFVEQVNERRKAGIERFYFQLLDPTDKEMVSTLTRTLKEEF